MTDSTENATAPKFTTSRYSKSSVRIQIQTESQFEFVRRDTEESEFVDLANFGHFQWKLFYVDSRVREISMREFVYLV